MEKKGEDQIYPHVIGIIFTDKMRKVVTRIDKKDLLAEIQQAKTDKRGWLTMVVQRYTCADIGCCTVYFRPYDKERDL